MITYELGLVPSTRQLIADERGSIVASIDMTGADLRINRYDEYGIPASTNQGRFQYTGQIWLPELGMYHYKARIYSPFIGRFLQTDPIGYDDQFNLYAYVGNDPVNRTDPTGMTQDAFELAVRRDDLAYLNNEISEEEYRERQMYRGAGGVIGAGVLAVGVTTRGFGIPAAMRWLGSRITSAAFNRAASRYPDQLAQNLGMTTRQLDRSIQSFGRRIAQHRDWISNPTSKIRNWAQLSDRMKRNILHHWRQDIGRHQAYREIARGVVRDRSVCTGTRICP